jgi:small GTP-binding protein
MAIMKAVVLGETEVGKTSFTTRWTTGSFPDPHALKTTVGASFDTKRVDLPSGKTMTLSLWDFGGQMRFIEALKGMIRGAKIGLFFFDVTKMATLDSIFGYWMPTVEENSSLDFSVGDGERFILVGNKIDLLNRPFEEVEEEMNRLAEPYGMENQLISARTGIGIESLDYKFIEIADRYAE